MAIELTRKRLRMVLAGNTPPLHVPPHVLAGVAAAVIAMSMASLVLGIRSAHRDASTARVRFADAQALIALPPIDTSALTAQLDQAKADLAAEQTIAAGSSIDPSSDAAAALLVRHSEAMGLAVKGISRITPAAAKFVEASYDVQGIRITVEGTPLQVTALLADLEKSEPSLVPSLATMTINELGDAHADLGFSVYTKIVPPPTVVPPPAKPKGKT